MRIVAPVHRDSFEKEGIGRCISQPDAGANTLMRAYQQASANGTALLLAVPGPIMRQVLSLNGPTAWSPSTPARRRPRRPQRKHLCPGLPGGTGQGTAPPRGRARCHLVYPANDDAGMPTAPGRQTNVAPACGSFCNWPVLSR